MPASSRDEITKTFAPVVQRVLADPSKKCIVITVYFLHYDHSQGALY